jgi:tetratricopeptide (TPR) repeat protein
MTAVLLLASILAVASPARIFSIFSPARGDAKKGAELHGQKKYRDAAARFGAAARRDPGDPAWKLDLGTALGAAGDRDKARAALAAVAGSADPRIASDALYQQGTLDLEAGKYPDAVEALRKSLALDPARSDAKRNYEIALRNLAPPPPQPKPSLSPKSGSGQPPPNRPPEKKPQGSNDPEFEKRAGMTRREAEEMLRSLDAEQRQREKAAAAVPGKDW